MKLVEIKPEGKILEALMSGPKSYSELKSITRLSDRWLSRKITELSSDLLIEKHKNRYKLKNPSKVIKIDPLFERILKEKLTLEEKARLIADEISLNNVIAVVLFGSLAKGIAREESDIDLLIIIESKESKDLNEKIYELMFRYDVPVEAVFLNFDEFLTHIIEKTSFLLGILEGYIVLYDRGGIEEILALKKNEVEREYFYDKVTDTWIQKKLLHTLS